MFQYYFGEECPHCKKMTALILRYEKEKNNGVRLFEDIEVWHDDAAAKKLEGEIDRGRCGGVPFFYNPKTDSFLCGEVEMEELEKWITDQQAAK